MTDEDRKAIREYMGWFGINHLDKIDGNFDLNDAGLVVKEMQKRRDWQDFVQTAAKIHKLGFHSEVIAWLMSMEDGQADNFFKAFVEWRKGK